MNHYTQLSCHLLAIPPDESVPPHLLVEGNSKTFPRLLEPIGNTALEAIDQPRLTVFMS